MPDEDYPLRAAGDALPGNSGGDSGGARLAFRLDGRPAFARLDTVDLG